MLKKDPSYNGGDTGNQNSSIDTTTSLRSEQIRENDKENDTIINKGKFPESETGQGYDMQTNFNEGKTQTQTQNLINILLNAQSTEPPMVMEGLQRSNSNKGKGYQQESGPGQFHQGGKGKKGGKNQYNQKGQNPNTGTAPLLQEGDPQVVMTAQTNQGFTNVPKKANQSAGNRPSSNPNETQGTYQQSKNTGKSPTKGNFQQQNQKQYKTTGQLLEMLQGQQRFDVLEALENIKPGADILTDRRVDPKSKHVMIDWVNGMMQSMMQERAQHEQPRQYQQPQQQPTQMQMQFPQQNMQFQPQQFPGQSMNYPGQQFQGQFHPMQGQFNPMMQMNQMQGNFYQPNLPGGFGNPQFGGMNPMKSPNDQGNRKMHIDLRKENEQEKLKLTAAVNKPLSGAHDYINYFS